MAVSRLCSIPDCGKPRTAKGEPRRYLHEVVFTYEGDECLIWPFAHSGGYGTIYRHGSTARDRVPRLVCEYAHGPAPTPKHEAAHSCNNGNKRCCAKRHLSWKTSKENSADQLASGTISRGSRHGHAKLTEDHVREIRALKGRMKQRDMSKRFGVSNGTINDIIKGRGWAWLDQ